MLSWRTHSAVGQGFVAKLLSGMGAVAVVNVGGGLLLPRRPNESAGLLTFGPVILALIREIKCD